MADESGSTALGITLLCGVPATIGAFATGLIAPAVVLGLGTTVAALVLTNRANRSHDQSLAARAAAETAAADRACAAVERRIDLAELAIADAFAEWEEPVLFDGGYFLWTADQADFTVLREPLPGTGYGAPLSGLVDRDRYLRWLSDTEQDDGTWPEILIYDEAGWSPAHELAVAALSRLLSASP